MPHAILGPMGVQAFILCGPGESLHPFNSNPQEFPKALIPIANRPMVWYPLEFCYRMGVTNIHLIVPPESLAAVDAALSQNPYLTALPSPRPTTLAPKDLTYNSGTADIFRLPEVQDAVVGDFLVLPCDLLCEIDGRRFLEAWMTIPDVHSMSSAQDPFERRNGLGVWYNTRDIDRGGIGMKKEETDFVATSPIPLPPVPSAPFSLRPHISNLVLAMPTASLQDNIEEDNTLLVRQALVRKHPRVKMFSTHRDAHIYFFPHWVKEFMKRNETFESIGEDVLGWWAKAGWQDGLAEKLSFEQALQPRKRRTSRAESQIQINGTSVGERINLASLSTTSPASVLSPSKHDKSSLGQTNFASRVDSVQGPIQSIKSPPIPSFHAYIHPLPSPQISPDVTQQKNAASASAPDTPLLRRIDTVQLLLNASLRIASLPPTSSSPYLHSASAAHNGSLFPPEQGSSSNTAPFVNSVVGMNVTVQGKGIRLTRCVVMDGVQIIGDGVKLTGCVLGRRCRIEGTINEIAESSTLSANTEGKKKKPRNDISSTELQDCYVQEGVVVPAGTTAKGEVIAVGFEGEDEGDEFGDEDSAGRFSGSEGGLDEL